MSDYRFNFATATDVPALAALIERAYRGPEAAKGWTSEAAILTGPRSSPAEIEALVRDPEARFVTARDGDRIAACALVRREADGAYFGMFAIDPDLQGGGLGKAMMAHCEEAVRVLWGSKSMRLTVISLRAALIEWYERRGYARTGESEPFPFGQPTGALRTDFDLTVLRKTFGGLA